MVYGDKFEYNYDEWVSTLYCIDNLLKLGDWRITYCNTELCIHNTVTYELIQRSDYF